MIQSQKKTMVSFLNVQKLVLASITALILYLPMAFAQEISLRLVDNDGEPVMDAVMELISDSNDLSSVGMREVQIDQRDKEFVPTVTTIVAGGSASFPNSDDILHHVYSFSEAKTFDTPLYGSDESNQYREMFETPGVVEIGCNIHDWMLAYIYVGQSEFMAISDESGVARLTGIPSGQYRLRIWHSRLDAPQNSIEQDIELVEGRVEEIDMTLEFARDRRVRRAPSSNRKRYR